MTYTRKMLALLYEVSYNTFKRRLAEIDKLDISKHQRVLTPKQIEVIFDRLGEPRISIKSVYKYS